MKPLTWMLGVVVFWAIVWNLWPEHIEPLTTDSANSKVSAESEAPTVEPAGTNDDAKTSATEGDAQTGEPTPQQRTTSEVTAADETLSNFFELLVAQGDERKLEDVEKLLSKMIRCRGTPKSLTAYRLRPGGNGDVAQWEELRENCDSFSESNTATVLSWLKEAADEGDIHARQLYVDNGAEAALRYVYDALNPSPALQEYLETVQRHVDEEMADPRVENLRYIGKALVDGLAMDPDFELGFAFIFADDLQQLGTVSDRSLYFAGRQLTDEQLDATRIAARAILDDCC